MAPSSSVPPLGPLTTLGFATQSSPPLSPDNITSRCGNVWPRFSVTLHPSHHGSWPVFRCTRGDWAFAVRPALPARHLRVFGLIVSTLWLNAMRTLPARWQRLSVLRQLTQSTSEQWQAVASLPRLGTTAQIGCLYLKERALVNRTLMRWIPGCPLMGGSSSQPRPWSNVTGPLSCGRVFPRPNKPSSDRNRGPCRGCPSLLFPLRPPTRFAPQLFRVLLLRRLWLALPLSSRTCRRGRPLDVLGHHRAACSRAGVLGSRRFSLESAAARVCREAGARVSTNLFVRDLDPSHCQP